MNFIKRNLTHKILPFFALFLFIFFIFLTTNLKATDEGGGGGSMGGRDGLEIPYDYYDSTGHRTGTVVLTQEMYDAEHWCLFGTEDGRIFYYTNTTGTLYFSWFADTEGYFKDVKYLMFCSNSSDWEISPVSVYIPDSQSWNNNAKVTKLNFKNINFINPSAIIKQKSMTVFYRNLSKELSPEWLCPPVDFPYIDNLNDIATGNFDNIYVSVQDCFNYGSLESSFNSGSINVVNTYKVNTFKIRMTDVETGQLVLNGSYADINETSSNFLNKDWVYYLVIPKEDLTDYNFVKGKKYSFTIDFDFTVNTKSDDFSYNFTQKYVNTVTQEFVFGEGVVPDKDDENTDKIINSFTNSIGEQTNAINNQTEEIKKTNETNVKIWDVLNPFSEHFFVYKLVEMFIEMLKGLFIPSNEFFSSYFSDLNDWFSDRFGFLYYPLDLFFDLADRFLHINFSDPVIDIPNIYEPTTNTILIHATKYNFNSLLEQNSLKTAHDIYLIIVDAIIYVGLVMLLYNKYEEVMTK